MTECHIIGDRMPYVANGKAVWRPSESAHLETCQDCRLEWELVRATHALGSGVVTSLDTSRIGERVTRRMAEADSAARPGILHSGRRWLIGLAAAAALVLVVRSWRPGQPEVKPPSPAAVTVLNELDDLTPSELESVLEALPPAAEAVPHLETVPFGDLEPQDLERMLRSLEG